MEEKDRPLMLRERADGRTYLYAPFGVEPSFPPRHEFNIRTMLEKPDIYRIDGETIVVTLANGRAVYDIDRTLMEEVFTETDDDGNSVTKVRQLSTGYWGILSSSEVTGATPTTTSTEEPSDG